MSISRSFVRALLGRAKDTGLTGTLERARDFALFAEHAELEQWKRFREAAVSEGGLPLRRVLPEELGADAGPFTGAEAGGTSVAR